ncbi:MAG: efflux RND transporter periplasmic adaptor subunit [Azoarcus sp.]|jgi:RND family efflux transporter MFP subunit|nr:efflux RND transporter periplasmic adaptor subunit [Azoarcus sp.]
MLLKKPSVWAAAFGLLLIAVLVYRSTAKPQQPAPPLPLPQKTFAHGIGASGIVEARQKNTAVGVPASGLVSKVWVNVWDRVEAGAALIELDDRELRAQLLGAQAQEQLKRAQLDRARDQYARLRAVDDPRAISAQDLKDRQLDVAVAEADLATARASVAGTEKLIDRLTVRAPVAGTILQVNVRAGEYVNVGATAAPILLGNIDDVWVRADIDEQLAPRVVPGKPAVGYLKGDAAHPIPMDFVRIEPYVIPKQSLTGASTERVDTRVLQVIYQFHNPSDRRIYAGQQMDLFIENTP